MKRWKIITAVLSGVILSCSTCLPVMAKDYTYQVRIFAGQQGEVNGDQMWELEGLEYGDQVSVARNRVTVEHPDRTVDHYNMAMAVKNDKKYYLMGIRESGRDNNTASSAPSFPIERDVDYVIAYGVLGNSVAYTINYVDAEGNALAESETYYGNIGDKPVVAYLYIEGYEPQAYNLTRTLSENAAANVFTFVYTPIGGAAPAPGESGGGTAPAAPAAPAAGGAAAPAAPAAGAAAGAGAAGAAGAGAAGAAGAGAAGAGAAGGLAAVPDEETPAAGPQELVDLDEGDVPLAGQELEDDGDAAVALNVEDYATPLANLPLPAKIGVGLGGLAALGAGLWYFLVYRRKKQEDE